jgi:hypothetical protein
MGLMGYRTPNVDPIGQVCRRPAGGERSAEPKGVARALRRVDGRSGQQRNGPDWTRVGPRGGRGAGSHSDPVLTLG